MSSIIDRRGTFALVLADHLERIEHSPATLKDRLRSVLADLLGRTLSDGLRDVAHAVLEAVCGNPTPSAEPIEPSRVWSKPPSAEHDPDMYDDWPDELTRRGGAASRSQVDATHRRQPNWLKTAEAVLRTTFWLLPPVRRSLRDLLVAGSAALVAAAIACWRPDLLLLGLDLIGSSVRPLN